jgi:hypothetical protein
MNKHGIFYPGTTYGYSRQYLQKRNKEIVNGSCYFPELHLESSDAYVFIDDKRSEVVYKIVTLPTAK